MKRLPAVSIQPQPISCNLHEAKGPKIARTSSSNIPKFENSAANVIRMMANETLDNGNTRDGCMYGVRYRRSLFVLISTDQL